MSSRTKARRTYFTPDEANACLPLVRAIVRDMVALGRDVVDRRERLSFLQHRTGPGAGAFYSEELGQIEADLASDSDRLREYVRELEDLGVEPKSVTEGLVDFPARMQGRDVYLCWKPSEPEVLYWHEVNAGFAGRRPLLEMAGAPGSAAADAPDAEN